MPANTISDLTDNYLDKDITIDFTIMSRPTIEKKAYDQVVENAEQLVAVIEAAQKRQERALPYLYQER